MADGFSTTTLYGNQTPQGQEPVADGMWILSRSTDRWEDGQQISIFGASFTVGRAQGNNLCISDPTVSGRHAEILTINKDLFVRDLNSTNGTLLNGRRIQHLTGLRSGDVLHFGSVMFTLQSSTDECTSSTITADVSADALAHLQFDKLLRRPALRPSFQPIVRLDSRQRIGFEVLSRSYLLGLETPEKMFRVAASRRVEAELSRVCRVEGLRIAQTLPAGKLYLNTHPAELALGNFFQGLESLRDEFPAAEIVLEIHEGATASCALLKEIRRVAAGLGMELAYDDFGAGQARLKELFEVPPDCLKFDVKFIQGLPFTSPQQRETIKSLIRIVRELNVTPLAEGIETEDEADICVELGFELAQGFLFGRAENAGFWNRDVAGSPPDV